MCVFPQKKKKMKGNLLRWICVRKSNEINKYFVYCEENATKVSTQEEFSCVVFLKGELQNAPSVESKLKAFPGRWHSD